MLFKPKQLFISLSKTLHSPASFVEGIIVIILSSTLALMLLINGGVDPIKHAYIVPLFGLLIFLHGFYVFLRDKSKKRRGDYHLSILPFKFLPFLIWVIFSANFISPVPWLGQIYLIYYCEAFIILWMIANHVKDLKQYGIIFIGVSIPLFVHLFLGYDQFFHGKSLSELGIKKMVSGLFHESNSYVFLNNIVFAGIVPVLFSRYWGKAKRFVLGILFLLLALSVVMANNFQGFFMLAFAYLICSYFAFDKKVSRIKFLLTALVFSFLAYIAFYISSNLYNDYFYSAFNLSDVSYFLSAWIASVFLFFKNILFGVGLGGFESKLYSVKSFSFPLIISNPSNFYLLILAELGIIGGALLANPLLLLLKVKYKEFKSMPRYEIFDRRPFVPTQRFLLSILLSTSITFLLMAFFNAILITPFFLCFFAVLIAGLNFEIRSKSIKIERNNRTLSKKFFVRKSSHNARYYFGGAFLIAVLFSYDAFKVFKSQNVYENTFSDFQVILETPERFQIEDLSSALNSVEDSIKENKYNLDAWLLKHEILNALYNKNSIQFDHHPQVMLEASKFVLDRGQKYWLAWVRHGISLTLNGYLVEAENAFNQGIRLAPNNFETNFYMAAFLMNFKERFSEANKYIEKALLIMPSNPEAISMYQKLKL